MDAIWIILTGSLVATCCALLGCFLLLRKITMIGDAIAHAVLPGIVIAYFVTQSKASVFLLIGASAFGLITTLLIETLSQKAKMQSDAAIGVSFTWLFSIGIILISFFANQVELDQECVLYGEIAYTPLDTIVLGNVVKIPKSVWLLSVLLIGIILLIVTCYKALWITTFDIDTAASIGISGIFWHYVLMGAVSITTVLSFESVGVILVVAFLIGPASVSYLLTKNLQSMLLLSCFMGIIAAILGYFLATWLDGAIAGAMASIIGIEFLIAVIYKNFISKLNYKF